MKLMCSRFALYLKIGESEIYRTKEGDIGINIKSRLEHVISLAVVAGTLCQQEKRNSCFYVTCI